MHLHRRPHNRYQDHIVVINMAVVIVIIISVMAIDFSLGTCHTTTITTIIKTIRGVL